MEITIIGLIGYGIIAVTFIIFLWILIGKNGDKKLYNPKYAEKMDRMDGVTPVRGSTSFVVSSKKWVIIKWDKEKNILDIITAPQGWLKPKDKVHMACLNWRIVKEHQPEKVNVEKYFGNRRVM